MLQDITQRLNDVAGNPELPSLVEVSGDGPYTSGLQELWDHPEPSCFMGLPIGATKVCLHVPAPDKEVCAQVQIARVCIHLAGPGKEVCLQVQIAEVCIHVPGPQNEICVQVQIA